MKIKMWGVKPWWGAVKWWWKYNWLTMVKVIFSFPAAVMFSWKVRAWHGSIQTDD